MVKLSNEELDQLIYALMTQIGYEMEHANIYYRVNKDDLLLKKLEKERDAKQ